MKVTAKNNICPKCKTADMVMSMKTGNIHIYGCIKCRNAQGAHAKAKDARAAWNLYVNNFNKG